MLCHMLDFMDYGPAMTRKYVEFFDSSLASALGTFSSNPDNLPIWNSYMTDDFTPIEFSHSYSSKGRLVRFAIEPISRGAGGPTDPFNVAHINRLIQDLAKSIGNVDLTWYKILHRSLMADNDQLERSKFKTSNGSIPQFFVGFELAHEQASMKVYFVPSAKAACTGKTSMQLVSEVLPNLEATSWDLRPAFQTIETYLASDKVIAPKLEIVSVDCCQPLKSRLKLYIRGRSTSFQSVWDFFTLGGLIGYMDRDEIFHTLKQLWYLVLGLPEDFPITEQLAANDHETAGVIYYFSLRPGSQIPEPKLYIPVRHYARNDQEIADGIVEAFERLGWKRFAEDYVSSLRSFFPYRPLGARTGIQTYVAFSMKGGNVTIEPYLNPEIKSRSLDQ